MYHLHGYTFYVVGARKFGRSVSLQEMINLDNKGQLFSRNLDCAVAKDTVAVPKFSAVAIRFKADNPGKSPTTIIQIVQLFIDALLHDNFQYLKLSTNF